ncbi:EAP30/Vps36 family protein [Necator americanus]|uniref:Vacuolar protein-sorting-associated protein 36 n=1 Tax=Necator americanus TaxID=51031 RepID=W2T937_NECAM|nr:EAP30/Vps36 family protein [Necator americanus]ETN77716.1 EAP30/Vps36 family protein [Necator americanus]
MDRLTWYQPGESLEDLLCQAGHVGIYEGDLKHTAFEQGTASLTLHRVIWADSSDPDRRLILHHSLVKSTERHHKSMFSRGGKIIVRLEPAPPNNVGPQRTSCYNYIRFVFRNGGEDDFHRKYEEALKRKTWQRSSSGSSSGGSRTSQGIQMRPVGIAGLEKRLAENHQRTHETISQAFEDMSRLMETARDMVGLSKSIAEKLRSRRGEITEDETIAFKSYLLSLGVSDPVTKSAYGSGAVYFEKLGEELCTVLAEPLKECGGMMTLPEVYCRVNRARGLELLSPEDLLNACQALSRKPNSPMELHRFATGVIVLQLKTASVESMVEATVEFVKKNGSATASELATNEGITVILAKERLLAAEEQAVLCRDDSTEGLKFYPNRFLVDV